MIGEKYYKEKNRTGLRIWYVAKTRIKIEATYFTDGSQTLLKTSANQIEEM